jgi:hypothetical protein
MGVEHVSILDVAVEDTPVPQSFRRSFSVFEFRKQISNPEPRPEKCGDGAPE